MTKKYHYVFALYGINPYTDRAVRLGAWRDRKKAEEELKFYDRIYEFCNICKQREYEKETDNP